MVGTSHCLVFGGDLTLKSSKCCPIQIHITAILEPRLFSPRQGDAQCGLTVPSWTAGTKQLAMQICRYSWFKQLQIKFMAGQELIMMMNVTENALVLYKIFHICNIKKLMLLMFLLP
jgi:hypothetical protein